MRLRVMAFVSVLALGPALPPAEAAFHLMNVVEVFTGTPAAPGAQYVVLQMWSAARTSWQDHVITFYDRFGGVARELHVPQRPNVVPTARTRRRS